MLQQAGQNQLAGVKTEIRSPVPLFSFINNYLLAGPPVSYRLCAAASGQSPA